MAGTPHQGERDTTGPMDGIVQQRNHSRRAERGTFQGGQDRTAISKKKEAAVPRDIRNDSNVNLRNM